VRVVVIHGANLDRLGRREPDIYGHETLEQLNARIVAAAQAEGVEVSCRHSNLEGDIVLALHAAADDHVDGVVLNAGGYAHTSVAIRDAIRAVAPLPVVEVHLSNTAAREEFRHVALIGAACVGRVEGFGGDGYLLAIEALRLRARAGG
jgi:3-dehydroquinate dehydratase-2